jgi:cytochrome c-type biogenesis protein CcmE
MGSSHREMLRATAERSGRSWLAVLLACDAAILLLVFSGQGSQLRYSVGASEAVTLLGAGDTRSLRVDGNIVTGSLVKRAERCEYRFDLQDTETATGGHPGPALSVVYRSCVVPDYFGEYDGYQLELIVDGASSGVAGVFAAKSIATRCPDKYFYQQRPLPRRLPLREQAATE